MLERHRQDLASFAALVPDEGTLEQRLRAVVSVWLDYVEAHSYAWRMLFRDSGGGARIAAFRAEVHARARAVLAAIIESQRERAIPRRQVEPLAELLSMGMASLVLWWIEGAEISRAAVRDAIVAAWVGVLGGER